MKVELELPLDGIEADIMILDKDGNPLDIKLGKIVIEPYFYSPDGTPTVLTARVLSEADGELRKGRLAVSGTTAKLRHFDHTMRVVPAIEKKELPTK